MNEQSVFLNRIATIVNTVKKNKNVITEHDFLKRCSQKGLKITYPETFLNIYWRR